MEHISKIIDRKLRLERAKRYTFNKGKHKGKQLAQVIKDDYKYIENILNSKDYSKTEIKKYIHIIMYQGFYK